MKILPAFELGRLGRNLGRGLGVWLAAAASSHAATFYVDSASGDDWNGGTSITQAWRSLARVNTNVFQPGDIVVFFSPHDGKRLVKRVIGLPGDTIELRNNQLVLNGTPVEYQPIAEELLYYIPAAERAGRVFASEKLPGQTHAVAGYPATPAPRTFAPLVVPQGQYFVMGDDRDDSFDSRFWGTVKREKIVGRATAVVLSLDKSNYWLPRWKRSFTTLCSE